MFESLLVRFRRRPLLWDSRQVQRMVLPHNSILIRFTSGAVVRLADHRGVAISGSVLLRRVQALVHDIVGAVSSIRKPCTWCHWTATRTGRSRGPYGRASTISTACWTVLVLASGGLGLEESLASGYVMKLNVACYEKEAT